MFLKLAFLVVLGLAVQKAYADEPESIVGGADAYLGELPYQVSLRVRGRHFCGGTIVSRYHVITAAHCIRGAVNAPWMDLVVVTGSVTLNSGGEYHRVKDVRVHPDYVDSGKYSWVNDAALIYLEDPIQFHAYQSPIPMAVSEPPLNAALTVSGWGTTRFGGTSPNTLQKATLYHVSKEVCQNAHRYMPIYDTHICALNNVGIGACHGDSGGPLVHNGQLVGIASWVSPCALGAPDVFTRVSKYADFFKDVLNA